MLEQACEDQNKIWVGIAYESFQKVISHPCHHAHVSDLWLHTQYYAGIFSLVLTDETTILNPIFRGGY